MKKSTTHKMVTISVLSAIAVILMVFVEVPLGIFPGFLKLDFSDLPAILGGFALGPVAGIAIELIKNIIHFIVKGDGTGGIGNLANFLVGISFVVPAAIIYMKNKTIKTAVMGLIVGILSSVVFASIFNYFFLIPWYAKSFTMDGIIGWSQEANGNINDLKSLIIYGIAPFNLLKYTIVSLITFLLYKRLSSILHR